MLRTYDRFASPPECAATSNAGCGGGGGVIGAKDRPGNLTGASDPEVVAWAKQGHDAAGREQVRRPVTPASQVSHPAGDGRAALGSPSRRTSSPDPTSPPSRSRRHTRPPPTPA